MKKSLPRSAAFLAIACFFLIASRAALSAPATTQPASLLTADETRELNAVLDAPIAAGFPDTRKAQIYVGSLVIMATFDPTKGPPPFPQETAKTHMMAGNSTNLTNGYIFSGLHFKLADGSWIVALRYHFTPKPGDTIDSSNAHETKPANLTADAIAAHPFDSAKDASDFLATLPAADRPRAIAALDRGMPLTTYLEIGPGGIAPAAVLLRRAGWNDAEDLALVCTGMRACNYWEMQLWGTADLPFDPTGAHKVSDETRKSWAEAQKHLTLESPATAMRRAIFEYSRGQIVAIEPEDTPLSSAAAIAAAKASVDPKDPQHNLARVDALAASIKLPFPPAADAPLAGRLQSWEETPRPPRISYVVVGQALGASAPEAPPEGYTPAKADLDGLVSLLADDRPSRFWDFYGPRTLGDNAWRALGALLKADPRTLAGYPTDRPWTAAERQSAAKAVQAWWKTHRKEFVEK
ncbi:MAG TPA: hypothetical protein VFE47_26650 [Tepidisphaeraceae bacterium]|jgi:hypothetical protein|nr:hypothetical protein [Tepidisphaeraceae bacterium]